MLVNSKLSLPTHFLVDGMDVDVVCEVPLVLEEGLEVAVVDVVGHADLDLPSLLAKIVLAAPPRTESCLATLCRFEFQMGLKILLSLAGSGKL